jgi:hypothetical protein
VLPGGDLGAKGAVAVPVDHGDRGEVRAQHGRGAAAVAGDLLHDPARLRETLPAAAQAARERHAEDPGAAERLDGRAREPVTPVGLDRRGGDDGPGDPGEIGAERHRPPPSGQVGG